MSTLKKLSFQLVILSVCPCLVIFNASLKLTDVSSFTGRHNNGHYDNTYNDITYNDNTYNT
jgi:hypothetical protein